MAGTVSFIEPLEGLITHPYYDIAHVLTWCIGETEGKPKAQYTPEECREMAKTRVAKDYYAKLDACVNSWKDLPVPTRISITSFSYNLGVGKVCGKPMELYLEKGDIARACREMLQYNKAKVNGVKREVKGLTTRRAKEYALCMKGAA